MQQHGSIFFCRQTPLQLPPTTLGVGSKDQISAFSEHYHVAYQI